MLIFRMIIVSGDPWTAAFGASAITSEDPFSNLKEGKKDNIEFPEACYATHNDAIHLLFLAKAFGLGVRVGAVASQLSSATCHCDA
jgi:hypothetical protein